MKLLLYNLDNNCEVSFDDDIIVLEIENRPYFLKTIKSLKKVCDETSEMAVLSGGKLLDYTKECDVVVDYTNIDNSTRSIISRLYNKMIEEISGELDLSNQMHNILTSIIMHLDNLIPADLNVEFSEDKTLKDILCFSGLSLKNEESTFVRLLDRISIISELNLYKLMVLVNPKSYFTDSEMIELYRYALYKKVRLFIVENNHKDIKLDYERKIYVDEDMFDIEL